jgi:hypothetical protein
MGNGTIGTATKTLLKVTSETVPKPCITSDFPDGM